MMVRILQCNNLVNKDLIGKSDPVVLVDLIEMKSGVVGRLGKTEWIKNNLNPVFQTKIDLKYVFDQKQHLRITVLDVDDPKNIPTEYTPNVSYIIIPYLQFDDLFCVKRQMKEGDLLGRAEVSVPEIMGARNWTVTKPLTAQKQHKNYGTITVQGFRIEECFSCSERSEFQF